MKTIDEALLEMFDLYYVRSFSAVKDENGISIDVELENGEEEHYDITE